MAPRYDWFIEILAVFAERKATICSSVSVWSLFVLTDAQLLRKFMHASKTNSTVISLCFFILQSPYCFYIKIIIRDWERCQEWPVNTLKYMIYSGPIINWSEDEDPRGVYVLNEWYDMGRGIDAVLDCAIVFSSIFCISIISIFTFNSIIVIIFNILLFNVRNILKLPRFNNIYLFKFM